MTTEPYLKAESQMEKLKQMKLRAISSAIITPFAISAILIACTPAPSAEEVQKAAQQKLRGNELCYGHNGLKRIEGDIAVCNDGRGVKL
jgi:hypothetical protein